MVSSQLVQAHVGTAFRHLRLQSWYSGNFSIRVSSSSWILNQLGYEITSPSANPWTEEKHQACPPAMVATLTPNQCQTAPRDSRQHATLADSSKKKKNKKPPNQTKKQPETSSYFGFSLQTLNVRIIYNSFDHLLQTLSAPGAW